MQVKELKEKLKNVPDDVEIFIEDMENFSTTEFDVSTYYEGDTYIDFIIGIYIHSYNNDNEEEEIVLIESEVK